jgi:ACS family hexuronate transporter-like MFS transporter
VTAHFSIDGSMTSTARGRPSLASANAARKGTMGLLVVVMTPSVIVAGMLHDPRLAIALIAIACGAHQAWSTMVFTVATDLFPSRAVGSVSGFGGFIAGIVSIGVAEAVGRVLDRDATLYTPLFIAAGLLYPLALGVFHVLSPKMEPANVAGARQVEFNGTITGA